MQEKKVFIGIKSFILWIVIAIIPILLEILYLHKLDLGEYHILVLVPSLLAILILLFLNTKIIINLNAGTLKLRSYPLLELRKYRGLSEFNNNVNLSEIIDIQIEKLDKKYISKFVGTKYFFKKYLVIYLKGNVKKHLYISMFTKNQIKKLIKFIENNK